MQETSLKSKSSEEQQIVVFSLSNEEFGVSISEVREIIKLENITKIPNTEVYIEGVINLRGGIIVIIDLATKLGLQKKSPDIDTRIIVIEVNNNIVGMIVDSATEVLRVNSRDIKPAPAIITQKVGTEYIQGVGILGERLLILLDLAKILHTKDIKSISELQKIAEEEKAEKKGDV